MSNINNLIRNFWNNNPCGSTHIGLPIGSKEYFLEFDKYFESFYPYLLPFLNVDEMAGRKILVIGLGSGFELDRISRISNVCYGLDLSEKTILLNDKRRHWFGLKYHLIHASATDIPLSDSSIDAVVSIGCLHHIPGIHKAVQEIHRVLKPQGIFKGMVYNKNSWRYRVFIPISRLLFRSWKGKSGQECINQMYDGTDNPYGTVYSKNEIREMFNKFSDLAFKVENFVGSEMIPVIGDYLPRNFWLATMGKFLGLDLYFTATAVK